jgi:hypothetical protein
VVNDATQLFVLCDENLRATTNNNLVILIAPTSPRLISLKLRHRAFHLGRIVFNCFRLWLRFDQSRTTTSLDCSVEKFGERFVVERSSRGGCELGLLAARCGVCLKGPMRWR